MSEPALFDGFVRVSDLVRSTSARLEKRAAMAEYFGALAPEDLHLAATYLAGEIRQGALNVGWRLLRRAATPAPASPPSLFDGLGESETMPLTLGDVDAVFTQLKAVDGKGAQRRREAIVRGLLERMDDAGVALLQQLVLGELRQGALRARVIEALADARQVEAEELRRAIMVGGQFCEVVRTLAQEGVAGLRRFRLRPLVPVEPMLAATAEDLEMALEEMGPVAVEWKLDGVRIQLHRDDDEVRVYTRQLRDITSLVPDLADWARGLSPRQLILDGEILSFDSDGKPLAFQDLMSALSRETSDETKARLEPRFFDLLLDEDGAHLDDAYRDRRDRLESFLDATHLVPQSVVSTAGQAQRLFEESLRAGHEGIVLKSLTSTYAAGRRGSHWRKHKPAVTVDLVILAAEWGHGRRRGFLSNIHLGARVEDEPGVFAMLGKTFKGLTDAMLQEMTESLLNLESRREPGVVYVRPERVVEVAFDAVQRSKRYDSGLALRFARVTRFRPDKSPAEATTLAEIQAIHAG